MVGAQLVDEFNLKYVAITLRQSISASDNNWSALLYDGKDFHFSTKYRVHIVDRVGGGDAFSGGLIYALLTGMTPKDAVEFAKKMADNGVGQLLPTSKATDGTKAGFDLHLTRTIADATGLPVIASGGAGTLEHFYEAVAEVHA